MAIYKHYYLSELELSYGTDLGDRLILTCTYSLKILAVSCEYFDALFFGDFADRNKDEFVLQDVDFDDFAQFLKLLHPPYDAIDGT